MKLIDAKSILSPWSSGETWFGSNYNINIYKGCSHGCIYCDSRSECYRVVNFDTVRGKKDALILLEKELKSKRKKGIVSTGAMTDPYNHQEAKYKLTRGSLELINKYGFGASVLTKSDLVVRDMDVLMEIKEHSPAVSKFTITTFDDELCKKIEPNVAVTSKRFLAIKELSEAGIFTGVHMWPLLPFVNDTEENVNGIVRAAAENGAKFVSSYFGVTLRQNQRIYYLDEIDKIFPGMKQKYINAFGYDYECICPNHKHLKKVFVDQCNKYGLLYKMDDIRKAILAPYKEEQLSLF